LSADAYVHPQKEFTSTVQKALKYSGEHSVLLGVKPTRPEIGYGYIATKKMKTSQALQVEAFYEKPNHLTALKYIKKSNFYWNPGIFIWKTDFIISEFERHAPYIIEPLKSCYTDSKKLKEVFRKLPSEPVDTAILEKSNQILMVPASFQWDDVGSWLSLGRILPADQDHNYHQGNKTFYFKSSGNISSTKKELVAFLGTKDLIVVEEDDILFVSTKEALPDIKAMLSRMKENKDLQKYLE
jgi:mannose-1-phosphate guanylyltransferase